MKVRRNIRHIVKGFNVADNVHIGFPSLEMSFSELDG